MVVVPDLDLVVVTMADAEAVAHPKGTMLRRLVMDTVVPAFTPAGAVSRRPPGRPAR